MTSQQKNTILQMLVGFYITEYDKVCTLNVMSGSKISVTDYFNTITELSVLGHVSDVFLDAKPNFETDRIRSINFIPHESLKEFASTGGF